MKLIRHILTETMNPENNPRMMAATLGFVAFCIAMSFVVPALKG